MDTYILLDRTGSMNLLWDEAVSAVNAYVGELGKAKGKHNITLAVFDLWGCNGGGSAKLQFDVLRDSVPISKWEELKKDEVSPRGMTPLFDAMAKIISMAEEANKTGKKKTAIVVMTDGEENASTEVNKDTAKAALDRVQAKKWQVNFLGANFDGFNQATGLGVSRDQAMNFAPGSAVDALLATAHSHVQYCATGNVTGYTAWDRKSSHEKDVK